jgi:hypothetical protein
VNPVPTAWRRRGLDVRGFVHLDGGPDRLQRLRRSVFLMGWTGGYVLLALLLAPYLRKFGKFTVPEFIGDRYYSQPRASSRSSA